MVASQRFLVNIDLINIKNLETDSLPVGVNHVAMDQTSLPGIDDKKRVVEIKVF
jgi:hypothetical protein